MKYSLSLLFFLLSLSLIPVSHAQTFPNFEELARGEWSQIPVEEGICLYGDEYSFFVHPAESPSEKLMIYFQGGGACWDGLTCGSIGEYAVDYTVTDDELATYTEGYFDFDNPLNPVRDYNIVYVPYCTGDVHTGDKVLTFDVPEEVGADFETITVNFMGQHNADIALNWVYENFANPEQVFVAGCSAGGYGAVHHASFIMEHYADVPAVLLADSSHGVIQEGWIGFTEWGTLENLPSFIEDFNNLDPLAYNTSFHVTAMSHYFPENRFAQYNSFLDVVQIGYYGVQLGYSLDSEEQFVQLAGLWTSDFLSNIRQLAQLENFSYYTAGGTLHCIDPRPYFYQFDVNGVLFADWLDALLNGEATNITCNFILGQCLEAPVPIEY